MVKKGEEEKISGIGLESKAPMDAGLDPLEVVAHRKNGSGKWVFLI